MSHAKHSLITHARHAAGIAQSIVSELRTVENTEDDRAAMLECRASVLACISNTIRQLTKAERYLDAYIPPGSDEDLSAPRFDAEPSDAA